MNASFDRLHLVNTYGAFGSVTKVRREVIIEGTTDEDPGPDTEWLEYEVRGKPGDVRRRPPQVAPYHLRLGWLLWFVALSPGYGDGWLRPLFVKLLEADPATLRLFDHDPFDGAAAGVRARPAVPLRAHDAAGAARDRRVVAAPADRRPAGADGLRPPLSASSRPRAAR